MTTVLVVDDVPENLALLSEQFDEAGYETLQASSGSEALRIARTHLLDCILLDILMPGMDGLDTLRQLKREPGLREVPVILVSARNDEAPMIEGLRNGAHDYVTKPISFPLVLARTEAAIKLSHFALRQKRTQTLATIGSLVGGIAHEFNNLATIIMGNAELLMRDAGVPAASRQRLSAIHAAAERGSLVTQDLLSLSEPRTPEGLDDTTPLDEVINTVFKLCRKRLVDSKTATIIKGPVASLHVMMPRQSLVQVLINLVINAIQAMAEADERKLTISGQARGDRAIIDLIDTGCGIPVADQARIFLPFFSTRGSRPSGTTNADTGVSGLGLGLTVVTQLLEHHRGSIRVHSKPGRGSCFRLSLPLAHRATAPSSDSSGTYRKDLSGLRVLIVDDEPSIREIVATMVEEFGGQATAVPDGRTALDRLHDHTFEAVIVDWSMPVMGGREFLDRLHQERPGPLSHVLVASGLIHDEEIRHIRQLGVQNILSKPIHQKHLLTALRRLRRARPA